MKLARRMMQSEEDGGARPIRDVTLEMNKLSSLATLQNRSPQQSPRVSPAPSLRSQTRRSAQQGTPSSGVTPSSNAVKAPFGGGGSARRSSMDQGSISPTRRSSVEMRTSPRLSPTLRATENSTASASESVTPATYSSRRGSVSSSASPTRTSLLRPDFMQASPGRRTSITGVEGSVVESEQRMNIKKDLAKQIAENKTRPSLRKVF
jgi:hypothetical protein